MNSRELRITFVGMLFALAVGDLGKNIATFALDPDCPKEAFVITHYSLAGFILISSWVGWQRSKSTGNQRIIETIFDQQSMVLILDVVLVIIYYVIVISAEYKPGSPATINSASAKPESSWTILIFSIYLFWDVLTKLFNEKHVSLGNGNAKKEFDPDYTRFFRRSWITFLCLISSGFIYISAKSLDHETAVIVIDLMLIALFVIFRGVKDFQKRRERLDDGSYLDHNMFYKIRIAISIVLPILMIIFGIVFLTLFTP